MPTNGKTIRKATKFHNRINVRIISILLILFSAALAVVSIVNSDNIRRTYEENFTQRVLLTNALMANSISSDDVEFFVELMTNQDEEFKQRQVQYYYDRLEYWNTPEKETPDGDLVQRLEDFRAEMLLLKASTNYWGIIEELKNLNELSHSAYLYVMANTGLKTNDGEVLYTFIFANDDDIDADVDADGLGSSDTSLDSILTVYETKKQMDWVDYYNDVYGELYYAYAPILNEKDEVIAVFGTDLDLGNMNHAIAEAALLTNIIFLIVFIITIVSIFIFLHMSIVTPLKGLTNTAYELAEGNIYANPSKSALKQGTEIGTLAAAINEMSLVYQDMVKNAGNLFSAAKIGKLDIRNDISIFKGDIKDFIIQTNDTLDATTLYLNSIPESIVIMNKKLDIYFRNELFKQAFNDLSGMEFMAKVFIDEASQTNQFTTQGAKEEFLMKQITQALQQAGSGIQTWINESCFSVIFKEIALNESMDNSILVIAIDITDLIKEKENAQAAAKAKSGFLSRMSHEMRTPMNAIIGMTKIAENTNEVSKLKYCLSTIDMSANHLLGIINDVLDMSKIEAGKFELENIPINIEKIVMNVCNIVIENMEKKHQKFNVILDKGLELNYLGDGLRISQVITNLLSNAIKFTPESGRITLSIEKIAQHDETNVLRFKVVDTGIGMTPSQLSRLFNAFEQADGSVSRKYGGTGLGLAISKNIVEKMRGKIWAESTLGEGSTFVFEIMLERTKHQNTIIFDGIRPENIKLLVVESDVDMKNRFLDITNNFGIKTDAAGTAEEAVAFVEKAKSSQQYDIIFLAYDLPEENAFSVAKKISENIDKNTVIIITTFMEWRGIEKEALQNNITRFITKPLFPSSILDSINDTIGNKLKSLEIKTTNPDSVPDFSDIRILLAEDVEINREIFLSLLEDTKISVDSAENGLIAVAMFKENPQKYDLIIMDIQMPVMDGFMATETIRHLDIPHAKTIPIIAMTANAFKEDIDQCLEAGMNDHLAKPINEKLVIEKIAHHVRGKKNSTKLP